MTKTWNKAQTGMDLAGDNAGQDWGDEIDKRAMRHAERRDIFDVSVINVLNPDCRPKNPTRLGRQNAWGHLTRKWVKQGWCEKTGRIVSSRTPDGNCHKVCELRSLIYRGR